MGVLPKSPGHRNFAAIIYLFWINRYILDNLAYLTMTVLHCSLVAAQVILQGGSSVCMLRSVGSTPAQCQHQRNWRNYLVSVRRKRKSAARNLKYDDGRINKGQRRLLQTPPCCQMSLFKVWEEFLDVQEKKRASGITRKGRQTELRPGKSGS